MLTFCPLISRKMLEHWSLAELQFENVISGVVHPSYIVNRISVSGFSADKYFLISSPYAVVDATQAGLSNTPFFLVRGANIHQPPWHTATQRGKDDSTMLLNSVLISYTAGYTASSSCCPILFPSFLPGRKSNSNRLMMCQIPARNISFSRTGWNCKKSTIAAIVLSYLGFASPFLHDKQTLQFLKFQLDEHT